MASTCGTGQQAGPNFLGRLISVSSGNSTTSYGCYDPLGRVWTSTQTTGGTVYGPFSYQYNLAGAPSSETYPSGLVVTNSFDAAGRVTQVAGNMGINYAQSVSYVPQGVNVLTLGNNLTESWSYGNAQKQPTQMVASALQPAPDSSYKVNATWGWAYGTPTTDNGNVTSASITGLGVSASQSFAYDHANRLTNSSETGTSPWSRNYDYDPWANGWVTGYTGQAPNSFTPVASSNFLTNNRLNIQGAVYDNGLPNGVGNQTTIGAYNSVYDAENRLTSSGNGVVAAAFTYDGDGRRVQKVSGGTTTNYLFSSVQGLSGPPKGVVSEVLLFVSITCSRRARARGNVVGKSGASRHNS